jgi:hypothetical protein
MKDREPEFFEVIQPIVFGVTVLGRDDTGHVGNRDHSVLTYTGADMTTFATKSLA